MTDMELLDFMVRQYKTQANLAQALSLGDSAISRWRTTGQLPNAWKMYFKTQWDKKDAPMYLPNNTRHQGAYSVAGVPK